MAVLVFVDESRWERPGEPDYFATIAGAAIEEAVHDDLCRKIRRLKERFFKQKGISDYELRGRSLLNKRALSSFRKVEFVLELFSLCRLQKVVTFSASRRCSWRAEDLEPGSIPEDLRRGNLSASDHYSEEKASLLLAYLVERVNSFMLEKYPGHLAKLIFREEEAHRDRVLASSVMNFVYKTSFGGGFHGILGSPFFMPSALSPGLQLADLFAYIINQHHGGRREMKDFFAEVEAMQFVSSIAMDEYELKGMNLIE